MKISKFIPHIFLLFFLFLSFYFSPIYSVLDSYFFYDIDDKLWAHKVLEEEKAYNRLKQFNGLEIDVFFDNEANCFYIRHHDILNNQTLEDFLTNIDESDIYYWIDFKNIEDIEIDLAVNRMIYLNSVFSIKDRIIIESKNIILLSYFKKSNFNVSYCVPTFKYYKSPFNIYQIKAELIRYQPDAISCDYKSVDFYSNKFPNYSLLCWTNDLDLQNDSHIVYELCEKKNVRIVLTDSEINLLRY